MKKFRKAWLLSFLSILAVIPFSLSTVSASATTNIGSPVETLTSKGWGKYYQYSYSDSSGKQRLFYGEYKPSDTSDYEFVVHTTGSLATVQKIAQDYETQTGRDVKMAINGDFFDSTYVTPIDSMVMEGVVYYQGAYQNKNAFGFDNNGNFAIGRMTQVKDLLQVVVKGKTYQFPVSGINVEPDEGELSIYTIATNMTIRNAGKYVIRTSEDMVTKRPISGKSYRMTTGTVVDDKAFTLNAGEFAIVVKGENKLSKFMYNCIKYGTEVSIVSAPAGAYDGMQYVVGGWDVLVNNGVEQTSTHSTASDPNGGGYDAPRTIIGSKEDGTIFCAVLDGRQSSWSVGCTVQEEADLAETLGAKYALELDGGGSSTFLYDKGNGLELLNKPSDGSMRAVYNAVLLVEKGEDKGYYTLDDYVVPGEETSSSEESSSEEDSSVEESSSEEISVEDSSEDVSVENSSEEVSVEDSSEDVSVEDSSEEVSVENSSEDVSVEDSVVTPPTSSEDSVETPPASSEDSVVNSTADNSSADITAESTAGSSEETSSEKAQVKGCGGMVSGIGVMIAGCFVCATALMKKRNN